MSEDMGFTDSNFRQKPNIEIAFLRVIDRANQVSITDPFSREAAVNQILANLPARWRDWVKAQSNLYTDSSPRWVYKTYAGVRIGTPEAPMLRNPEQPVKLTDDGEIDWTDPNIYSPHPDTDPDPINSQIFNELVMQAAEHAALTWTVDPLEQDAGDTEEYIIERKQTPFRPQYKPEEDEEE